MATLKENQIYAIDGGLFRAILDEERESLQLWTHEGHSGRVIARTGFDVDTDGKLYHRVFDFETREQIRIEPEAYTVDDLETVSENDL